MKQIKIIVALMMIILVMMVAVACNFNFQCDHVDENLDHQCDACEAAMGECADADKDHKCDYGCDKAFGTHEEAEGSHTCDYCGEKVSDCADNDNDHNCDVCDKPLSTCEENYDEGKITTPAACTDKGVKTYTCAVCGATKTEDILPTGHTDKNGDYECDNCYAELCIEHKASEAVKENEVASTCTVAGSYESVVYCSVCKEEMSRETKALELADHTPSEAVKENEVASTCTVAGSYESVVYCSVCKVEMSRETKALELADHTPSEAVKEKEVASTCTVAGSYDSVVYCSVCKVEMSRETKALELADHSYAYSAEGVLVYAVADGSYDDSAVAVKLACSVCGASEAVSDYTIDVANVFADGASVTVGETTLPVSVSLKYVGTEEAKEFTLGASEVVFAGLTVENARLTINGNVTVNGDVMTTESWLKVDDNAIVNISGLVTVNNTYAEDATAEYGYDHRLFIRQGTVNLSGMMRAYSIQIGSEKDNTKGYLNITYNEAVGVNAIETPTKTNSNWAFVNGELNCTGSAEGTGTALCMNTTSTTRYMTINPGMKVTISKYEIGIGSWSAGRYITIYANTIQMSEVKTAVHGNSNTSNLIYPKAIVQMEYTDEATGRTEMANVELQGANVGFSGDKATLDFIVYPTAESYSSLKFISWVNETECDKNGHDIVIDNAKEATCTEAGLTAGQHCSRCQWATVAQKTIEATGHAYDDAWDTDCNVCGEVREITCEHAETEILAAVAPTCITTGWTEGSKCKHCGAIVVEQEEIPVDSLNHVALTHSVEGTLVYAAADGSYDNSAVVVTAACSACEASEAVSDYTVDVANVFADGASISVGETTLPVSVSLKYVGTEEAKEFTLGASEVAFAGITVENAKLTINGNVTVNGNIETSGSWFIVDNNAVVNVAGRMIINGGYENTANSDAEDGYDHRLFIRYGTVNINYNVSAASVLVFSLQIGSERDNTKGYLNIVNKNGDAIATEGTATKSRWVFANGEVNCTGHSGATALCLSGATTRYVEILAGIKITMTDYKYGLGTWSSYKYIGLFEGTLVFNNVTTWFHGYSTSNRIYPKVIVQVEYTDAEGRTGLANMKLQGAYSSFKGDYTSLDFVSFPTAEDYANGNYDTAEFISWVE